MKIVFILGSLGQGGAERVVANLANYYSENGHKVSILMLLENNVEYDLNSEIKIEFLETQRKNMVSSFLEYTKKIRENKHFGQADIVVSFFARINVMSILANKNRKNRLIISERNDPKRDGRDVFTKMLTKVLYRKADVCVFQTPYARRCFPKLKEERCRIIENPITVTVPEREKNLTGRIVNVGRLVPQKNQEMLIKAFANVAKQLEQYRLEIYGEGALRGELQTLIDELGMSSRIFLKGNSQKIFEVVYDADLFVLSSDFEGMSNALMEAMALKTPILTTDVAGVSELLKDNSAMIVPRKDQLALENAMTECILNYNRTEKYTINAKKTVSSFDIKIVSKKWNDAILGEEK